MTFLLKFANLQLLFLSPLFKLSNDNARNVKPIKCNRNCLQDTCLSNGLDFGPIKYKLNCFDLTVLSVLHRLCVRTSFREIQSPRRTFLSSLKSSYSRCLTFNRLTIDMRGFFRVFFFSGKSSPHPSFEFEALNFEKILSPSQTITSRWFVPKEFRLQGIVQNFFYIFEYSPFFFIQRIQNVV